MKTKRFLYSSIIFSAIMLPSILLGQNILPQPAQDDRVGPKADSVVLEAFPVTGITEAIGATGIMLAEAEKHDLSDQALEEYFIEIDTLSADIAEFMGDTTTLNLEEANTRILDQITTRIRLFIDRIDLLQGDLTPVALDLENTSEVLLHDKTRWQLTLEKKDEEGTVELRAERINRGILKIDSVRSLLQEDLVEILEAQDQLTETKLNLELFVERVREKRIELGETLISIDAQRFFRELGSLGDSGLISSRADYFKSTVKSDYEIFKSGYIKSLVIGAICLVLLLIFAFWFKKHQLRLITQDEFKLTQAHKIFVNSPLLTTLFVIPLMIRFLIPGLPQTFYSINILILLIPMGILVVRIVGKEIRTWIFVLIGVYALMFIYELAMDIGGGVLARLFVMLVSFIGIWVFIWVFRKKPFSMVFRNKAIHSLSIGLMMVFAGMQVISIIANLVGAFRLAEYTSLVPLQITLLIIVIQLASLLVDAIVFLALSSKHLQKINVIKDGMEYIHKKTVWLVDLALWLFALVVILRVLLVKDVVFDWGSSVLTESKNIWNINFTVGNILIFFFVIWLSVMITRIVTRILEKDVFTRVTTAKGMPSTIILLLRITLITGGFFLAVGAAGMKFDNLSIILGAFSVGIGFGLQNIFNNMVSGLILAFERPIKVGDVVQVGELMGTVKSIGLRSSNVRSFDGAEVIVPNGNLISNQMINWTKSDYFRRMDIRVGVAYGTDPETVLNLLEETVRDYSEVRKHPAPKAYFLGFGESSLDFRLLAWVHLDIRLTMESELRVTINSRLKEAGIEIPFPQHDLHIRSDVTKPKPGAGGAKK